MVLVIDIGNTNIKLAVFEDGNIAHSWRIDSQFSRTADEYAILMQNLLASSKVDKSIINGVMISSVIPKLTHTIEHMCCYLFGIKPLILGAGVKTGLAIKYDNPKEVGADRVAECVAAAELYGAPVIVVGFGTATTFNAVSAKSEFLGGLICPGIKMSADALVEKTAKLPAFELVYPREIIGKNTVANMQSGISYGFTGLVEYIITELKKEKELQNATVVATGGLFGIIAPRCRMVDIYDRTLTLKGLDIIYKLNTKSSD